MKASSGDRVIVDTTVTPKAIAHPIDSRLLQRSLQHLGKAAEEQGLNLRQSYNRIAPRLAAQIGCYAHAKQFKRMRRAVRTHCACAWGGCRARWRVSTWRAARAGTNQGQRLAHSHGSHPRPAKDKNKPYALHVPVVECISKARPNALRVRREGEHCDDLEARPGGGHAEHAGNLHDGHTLAETLEQVSILAECKPTTAIVDKGYKGAHGHNLRLILAKLRLLCEVRMAPQALHFPPVQQPTCAAPFLRSLFQ